MSVSESLSTSTYPDCLSTLLWMSDCKSHVHQSVDWMVHFHYSQCDQNHTQFWIRTLINSIHNKPKTFHHLCFWEMACWHNIICRTTRKYLMAQTNLTMVDICPFFKKGLVILLILHIMKYPLVAATKFSSNFACRLRNEEKSILCACQNFLSCNISKMSPTDFLLYSTWQHWWWWYWSLLSLAARMDANTCLHWKWYSFFVNFHLFIFWPATLIFHASWLCTCSGISPSTISFLANIILIFDFVYTLLQYANIMAVCRTSKNQEKLLCTVILLNTLKLQLW